MWRRVLGIAVAIVIAALILVVATRPLRYHRREVRVYFRDAQGLRAGAPVRMAGVDIGSVVSVRVRPDQRDTPAEVIMALQTPYELKIPRDATVSLETAGVLGPTFAGIDIIGASGPPLENRGVLKSKESTSTKMTTEQLLERVADIVKQKPCVAQATGETPSSSGKSTDSHPQR